MADGILVMNPAEMRELWVYLLFLDAPPEMSFGRLYGLLENYGGFSRLESLGNRERGRPRGGTGARGVFLVPVNPSHQCQPSLVASEES